MKKYIIISAIIGLIFSIWSCEENEIWLNKAGNPADLQGVWVTSNYIEKTSYLANPPDAKNDVYYRDTVTIDSTTLTFSFGNIREDSVQITAVKVLKGINQAPVKLANGSWSFSIGTTSDGEKKGLNYFTVYQTALPNNAVVANTYGTTYSYKFPENNKMEIRWVVSSGSPQNTVNYRAILNKQ
jgi:hypothetical protein